ncbi:hypothetical protein ACIO3R_07195 [Streptomyces sp. NPDC087428]|uniref:hypothetical protein n=1 Tax=Streptomyces sp. NPDC087428 TaxID=3365788 RepID=UPI0038044304
MPMIVDPNAPQVTPPERVVSPDGWLAAIVDDLWAGVTLTVDYATPADTARNLVLNPSFEAALTTETSGYGTNSTRTRVSAEARIGQYSVQHAITVAAAQGGTNWNIEPVAAGSAVQFSVWVKIPATGVVALELWWRSQTTNLFALPVLASAAPGAWAHVSGSYTVAAGQTCDRVAAVATAGTGPVTWWADAAMAEVGPTAHPYVDGSQPGCVWDGASNASTSRRVTTALNPGAIRKVRIMRTDPGAAPVPVRSADPAWAIGGVGTAYDHEAPLGVAVVYTGTPIYEDGTTGPQTMLAVTVPAPAPGQRKDLWIKSLDVPGLSTRVMVTSWGEKASAGRQSSADVQGAVYRALAYDVHGAETAQVSIDVPPEAVERVRELLRSGILLAQVRPGYLTPDAYFVPGDITGPTPTGRLGSSGGYGFTFTVEPLARPATADQPMRLPNWSWDTLAATVPTWDAVAASYASWASLSTNGVT